MTTKAKPNAHPKFGPASSPRWVLKQVVAGDVYLDDDFDYKVFGAQSTVTDTVYRLETDGLVVLLDDGLVKPTTLGETTHVQWEAETAAAKAPKVAA